MARARRPRPLTLGSPFGRVIRGRGGIAAPPDFRAWTPFRKPARPPAGRYDPALDAQERAARRGYEDLQQDVGRDRRRLTEDYGLNVRDTQQSFDWGMEDLGTSRDRGTEDLATALRRGQEDYGTNTEGLRRSYTRLGEAQAQGAQAAGVAGGGALAAALRARAENQGIEQSALDTNFGRFTQDNTVQQTRLGEDYTRSSGRMGTQNQEALGRLELGRKRGVSDLATQLSRGGRENTAFGQDVAEQRFFQAGQAGWTAPNAPASQKRDKQGVYRVETFRGRQYKVRPDGSFERIQTQRKRKGPRATGVRVGRPVGNLPRASGVRVGRPVGGR